LRCSVSACAGQRSEMSGTRSMNVITDIRSGGAMTQNKIPRYNVYVSDMFKDTKQPKKHQERFIRKLLGDDAYYKRWRLKNVAQKLKETI